MGVADMVLLWGLWLKERNLAPFFDFCFSTAPLGKLSSCRCQQAKHSEAAGALPKNSNAAHGFHQASEHAPVQGASMSAQLEANVAWSSRVAQQYQKSYALDPSDVVC